MRIDLMFEKKNYMLNKYYDKIKLYIKLCKKFYKKYFKKTILKHEYKYNIRIRGCQK